MKLTKVNYHENSNIKFLDTKAAQKKERHHENKMQSSQLMRLFDDEPYDVFWKEKPSKSIFKTKFKHNK